MRPSCSHSTAICNQRFNNRIELRTYDAPAIAEHKGGTNTRQNDRPAPAAHTRYLSSPAGATLPNRNTGLRAETTSQNQAHATSMQPLQCVLQKITSQTRISRGTWQHNMATSMQPSHCDLQPIIPNYPITATHKHAQGTLKPHQQCGTVSDRPSLVYCYLLYSVTHRPSLQSIVI